LAPGDHLKKIRIHLGITVREVQGASRRIAAEEGNEEFVVSHARLVQIENDESTPSIYKLFSLSAIYGKKFSDLLALYVNPDKISSYQLSANLDKTRLASFECFDKDRAVSFPIRFDPGFQPEKTNLLSRVVEVWGEVPVALVEHLSLRRYAYGFIGLQDYTLHPLLRPGSFVQIDDRQKVVQLAPYRTEFDRPIYFIELRDGYLCSWCELSKSRLFSVPHPLSPCRIREFAYPAEAEIVGRVTAVAARLVNYSEGPRGERVELLKQP
jgi:transcriptional regulator with XRE-family HTH domain